MIEHQLGAVERHIIGRAHRQLDLLLGRIESAAGLVGVLGGAELGHALAQLLDDLDHVLLPHIEWEEQLCFPETDELAGTPWATRLLRLQHEQISACLEGLRADVLVLQHGVGLHTLPRVRAHLHGLHALLTSHLEQEERALLALLLGDSRPGTGRG